METKKVKQETRTVKSNQARARLRWVGRDADASVACKWEDEGTVRAMKAMLELVVGEDFCWVEYQH